MVKKKVKPDERLLKEIMELRSKLSEAEETIHAIRNGEVDAIIVSGEGSEKIFSLTSAETPYRWLVEDMKEGAVTLSEDGIILYCNQSFEELVSVPMEQIIGSNFKQFLTHDQWPVYNSLISLSELGKKEQVIFYPCGEKPKYLHLSFYPIPEGILGKICIIVSDITELKKYENDLQLLVDERTNELQKAVKELNDSNATKNKLFSIIAHDLKGPFTALLGFSEMLAGSSVKYDTGQFEMMISSINSAAKSAYALLENLLLWALAENGKLEFKPEKTDICLVLDEILKSLKSTAAIKNISLEHTCTGEISAYVDLNMFKVILRNLISNAIKFTFQSGRAHVIVKSEDSDVQISVIDNGMGMSKEYVKNLVTGENINTIHGTNDEKGTGLGLILCKEFVQNHGGKLTIESRLGAGSSFTVTFPQKAMVAVKD